MTYTKTIICLANSHRDNRRCVAGKEVLDNGYGAWIRPVSAPENEAISLKEQQLEGGGHPKILDVISIPIIEPVPNRHQQENHHIDSSRQWKKIGARHKRDLPKLLDHVPNTLWVNSRRFSKNDRVPEDAIPQLRESLLLIQPDLLKIIVQPQKKIRCKFRHNQWDYDLGVTDPVIVQKYREKSMDHALPLEYSCNTNGVYLCVSLAANPYRGPYYYKIVATIIGDND